MHTVQLNSSNEGSEEEDLNKAQLDLGINKCNDNINNDDEDDYCYDESEPRKNSNVGREQQEWTDGSEGRSIFSFDVGHQTDSPSIRSSASHRLFVGVD